MVSLRSSEAKDALLENGIFLVPESEPETEVAVLVTDAKEAVFSPAIGTGTSMVMREVLPATKLTSFLTQYSTSRN